MRWWSICSRETELIDTDLELLERARHGDGDAFAALVHPHERPALRVAAVVLGTGVGADDVVQDAMVKAFLGLSAFRASAPFRPWFLRIVANTAHNQRRSTSRRARLALRAVDESTAPDPYEQVASDDDRRAVLAALNRLGRDDRLVIALRHFEQLSEAEMAMVLDCPAGTVKSRLSRAMARLREELSKESRHG